MPTQCISRYPLKRTHSGKSRVGLDSFGCMPTDSGLLFPSGAPFAMAENSGAYRGTIPEDKRVTSPKVSPRKRRSRGVRFDTVLKLLLVPARSDLGELLKDLWWQKEDYLHFRIGAIMDSSAQVLSRTLLNHPPPSFEPLPVEGHPTESCPHGRGYPHPAEIAQALQAVDCTGHVRPSSSPLPPLTVKRRAVSRRAQPPTPPTSPTGPSTHAFFKEDDAQEASMPPATGERSYVEDSPEHT